LKGKRSLHQQSFEEINHLKELRNSKWHRNKEPWLNFTPPKQPEEECSTQQQQEGTLALTDCSLATKGVQIELVVSSCSPSASFMDVVCDSTSSLCTTPCSTDLSSFTCTQMEIDPPAPLALDQTHLIN
jgi:hypothetical protein